MLPLCVIKQNKNSFVEMCGREGTGGGGRRTSKKEQERRRKKKLLKTKKAVYFMITKLTYANNFDIMKGMMNIKHIKIKISI